MNNTIAQILGARNQRPLGRTLQLRRAFDKTGMNEGIEERFYPERETLSARLEGTVASE